MVADDSGRYARPSLYLVRSSRKQRRWSPLRLFNGFNLARNGLIVTAILTEATIPRDVIVAIGAVTVAGDFYLAWLLKSRAAP
jgi:hypothetical protein